MTVANSDPFTRNQVWVGQKRIAGPQQLPAGVTVIFHDRSAGNVVHFAEDNRWHGVVVDLSSAIDCTVRIGAIRVNFGGLRVSFVANSGRYSTGASVSIGDDCVFNGQTHVIGPLSTGIAVRIGRDRLFASNISVRGSSHHGLWDIETGSLLNPETGIDIADHVWLGDQVVVLNKARIAPGTVVGGRSIVNKPFTEPNVLLVGSPAVARRSGVEWTHEFPADNGASPRRSQR